MIYQLNRYNHDVVKSKPGLFFASTDFNKELISNCPLLSGEYKKPGSLSELKIFGPTPWILTGDIATILPFALNMPPKQKYTRRFVRVPLSRGPLDNHKNKDDISPYESVAVDYVLSPTPTDKYLLVLSGLSGGSSEGYVLDLVDYAVSHGWNCFVMLGRGLCEKATYSNATFHGARTSDAAAVAEVMKKSFGGYIGAVGISLGGMILGNAVGRDVFGDDVVAGVSICGGINIKRNMTYRKSKEVWQPVLVQGMKMAFTAHPISIGKTRAALGENADQIFQDVNDVDIYDVKVVTAMNKFRDVFHYYEEANPSLESLAYVMKRPLLCLHAMDDPIIHVDCIPTEELLSSDVSQPMSNYLFSLITPRGGHVGWPIGWLPWRSRWEFQNRVSLEFLDSAIALEKKKLLSSKGGNGKKKE